MYMRMPCKYSSYSKQLPNAAWAVLASACIQSYISDDAHAWFTACTAWYAKCKAHDVGVLYRNWLQCSSYTAVQHKEPKLYTRQLLPQKCACCVSIALKTAPGNSNWRWGWTVHFAESQSLNWDTARKVFNQMGWTWWQSWRRWWQQGRSGDPEGSQWVPCLSQWLGQRIQTWRT